MFINSKYILSVGFLFVLSCNVKDHSNKGDQVISPVDSLVFKLDSLTLSYSNAFQVVMSDSLQHLTMLNDMTNTIYFYDLKAQGAPVKLLHFEEGGEGLQNGLMSYRFHNNDSIFLMTKGLYTYLSNIDGELIDRYSTIDLNIRQSIYSTTVSPMIFRKGELYYNSVFFGYYKDDYKPLMKYNVSNKKVTTYGFLPEEYLNGEWGSFPYDYIYQVYDEVEDRIIFSFPASNELFEFDFLNDLKIINSSSYGDNISAPFDSKKYDTHSSDWNRGVNLQPIFLELFFDIESGNIIRVKKQKAIFDRLEDTDPKRKIELIKFSERLSPLSFSVLDDKYKYLTNQGFIYDGKLFFRIDIDDEDIMKFIGFDLDEI
ncbi:hypothetical protein DN752_03870 [Echinicola strongylocentroti]|uniref:DUF4221 domain-containing protein n=1 Tax=Echinicola strongylocentroti TaxID=1795355 RepID=A0A2Z4IF04_9BACT|nr:hypothetical protein [Echinicola strongylocentroti]AWW29349.1 hypothetical protein DN752_03870 [Echinicola strongylocentroti]